MKKSEKKPLQADIKREAIFNATKKVFLKQGYKSSSMDEIAREAGVSKRTVYDHFGTKKALFEFMLSTHWTTLLKPNQSLFLDNRSIADNLKHYAHLYLKFLYQEETIDLFRLLISEINQFPDLTSNILKNEKGPFTRALIEFLQQKKNNGELTINNAERAASYFVGLFKEYHFWPMMLGFTKQKKMPQQNKVINEVVEIFLKIYEPRV